MSRPPIIPQPEPGLTGAELVARARTLRETLARSWIMALLIAFPRDLAGAAAPDEVMVGTTQSVAAITSTCRQASSAA